MKFKGKIKELNDIIISDPSYGSNVPCRYENKNMDMKDVFVEMQFGTTDFEEDDDKHIHFFIIIKTDENECNLTDEREIKVLKNTKLKQYDIGVDTACFAMGTNDNGVTIFINEDAVNVVDDQNGLLSNSVKKIVCDSHGNYYIGTSEALSVVSLSGGVKVTKTFKNIKNVVSMTADDKGNVVGVTERGEVFWVRDGKIINPCSTLSIPI